MKNSLLKILGVFLIPFIWFICADVFKLTSQLLLPPLSLIFSRLLTLFAGDTIFLDFYYTIARWFSGFILGVTFGTFAGLIVGTSKSIKELLEFPLEFVRSLPVTAIFPLFLIVFGIGDTSKIAMAFTPTFLLMVVNTSYGVAHSDLTRRKMARVFGAKGKQIFTQIILMDALPQIFVGLRLSLSQSLIVTIVSEMFIGTDFGLGQRIYDSYLTNSISSLYAFLLILGVLGYAINKTFLAIEKRTIFWVAK